MLVEAGAITRTQLNEALRHQAHAGGRLGSNLVELGFIDEKTLAAFLAKQLSIPAVTAASIDRIRPPLLELFSAQVAERLRALPIREDAGRLWVAMTDPSDKRAIDELEQITRKPIRPMVAPELLMQYGLEKHYRVRRRPRIVEVKTSGAELLHLEGGTRAPIPAMPVPQHEAPVYMPVSESGPVFTDQLDSVTGYLDETSHPAPPVPPPEGPLTWKTLIDKFVAATTDEAVLDAAARYLAQDIPRVCVMLLRDGELVTWGGRGLQPERFVGLRVPLAELPLLAQSLASGDVLAGRLQPAALGRFSQPLGVEHELLGLILPVRIGKHAVGVILGLDATLEAMRKKPELEKLVLKLDQALHINYLRRLLLAL